MAFKGVFFISILILALGDAAAPESARKLPFLSARLSTSQSCQKCVRQCAPTSVSSRWLTTCDRLRQNLKNVKARDRLMNGKTRAGFKDALLYYCYINYCKSFKVDEYCGLHPKGATKRSIAALNAEIALTKRQRQGLEATFKRVAVPRFNHANYLERRAQVQALEAQARKNVLGVLNRAAENKKLKQKLNSVEYRRQLYETKQYRTEIDFYVSTRLYWTKFKDDYFKALETSAFSVRNMRNQLQKDATRMFKQVKSVRNFEKSIGNEERLLRILSNQKDTLTLRSAQVAELVKRADSDFSLFRQIGIKIAGLLDRMSANIESGNLDVGCTADSLAIAIAEHTTGQIIG